MSAGYSHGDMKGSVSSEVVLERRGYEVSLRSRLPSAVLEMAHWLASLLCCCLEVVWLDSCLALILVDDDDDGDDDDESPGALNVEQ